MLFPVAKPRKYGVHLTISSPVSPVMDPTARIGFLAGIPAYAPAALALRTNAKSPAARTADDPEREDDAGSRMKAMDSLPSLACCCFDIFLSPYGSDPEFSSVSPSVSS